MNGRTASDHRVLHIQLVFRPRKDYCCQHHHRACAPPSTPAPFDCNAGGRPATLDQLGLKEIPGMSNQLLQSDFFGVPSRDLLQAFL